MDLPIFIAIILGIFGALLGVSLGTWFSHLCHKWYERAKEIFVKEAYTPEPTNDGLFVWPDGTYCETYEVEQYAHMSDDYFFLDFRLATDLVQIYCEEQGLSQEEIDEILEVWQS